MIRWLGPDDLDAWRDIRSEALRLEPAAFLTSLAEFQAESDDSIRAKLAMGKVLAVFDAGRITASVAFNRSSRPQTRHRAELSAFYVRPEARGGGVAQGLMDAVLTHARALGLGQLELYVWAGNPRALAFYARNGFVQHGTLPNAVLLDGQAHDDFFMVCPLDR